MKRYYFLPVFIIFALFIAVFVFATSKDDIEYPVAELGNCNNETECRVYCDGAENMEICVAFAEKHNLIPKEDIEIAKKMMAAGEASGPGGCRGTVECRSYCDDINNLSQCLDFAKRHDLMPAEELEEAEKIVSAIAQGFTPPNNCKNKEACENYCSQLANMKECINFAKAAGLMSLGELEEAEKFLAAIERGVKPLPCRSKQDCESYCSSPANLEECITFAEAAGFMSVEEAKMVRLTGGKGPGDCRGKEECKDYCDDPSHMEACVNFAIEHGFMSAKEAERARKMIAAGFTSGPGGCKGKEECESYCDDISHMMECVDFAEKTGFMNAEDAVRARKMAGMGMSSGPGGCKGEEECKAFCENPANKEECINFSIQIGEMSPQDAENARRGMEMMQRGGPGGCKGEQECRAYCDDPNHSTECLNFSVQIGQRPPEEAERMMQQMQMMERGTDSPMMDSGLEGPSPEMMEQMIREETERRMQEEMQRQMEQQLQRQIPPPEGRYPFFKIIKKFLANVAASFGF